MYIISFNMMQSYKFKQVITTIFVNGESSNRGSLLSIKHGWRTVLAARGSNVKSHSGITFLLLFHSGLLIIITRATISDFPGCMCHAGCLDVSRELPAQPSSRGKASSTVGRWHDMLLIQWCQIQVDGKVIRHRTVGIAILGQDVHHNSITGCLV